MKGRNMTRWRDPAKDPRQAPKSNLITAEGAARLRGILDHLSRVKRPALSAKVGEAAALGDRSENADYTYNKKELNRVIARIRYLTKRLDELQVVDRLPANTDKVFFWGLRESGGRRGRNTSDSHRRPRRARYAKALDQHRRAHGKGTVGQTGR